MVKTNKTTTTTTSSQERCELATKLAVNVTHSSIESFQKLKKMSKDVVKKSIF